MLDNRWLLVAAFGASLCGLGDVDKSTRFTNVSGLTPDTAVEWNDDSNWDHGVPTADSKVMAKDTAFNYFIKMPSALTLNFLEGNTCGILLGEKLTFSAGTTALTPHCNTSWIFADVYTCPDDYMESDHRVLWFGTPRICGRVIAPKDWVVPAGGNFTHYLYRYAYSADPVRTDDFNAGDSYGLLPGSASYIAYVRGSEAEESGWSQTEGSPYIHLKSASYTSVAAGALVTGEGIPEGTFVKRVFPTEVDLELSQAATTTVESNTLNFAAIHPKVTMTVPIYGRQAEYTSNLKLYKGSDADDFRLDVKTFKNDIYKSVYNIGLEDSEIGNWKPGTLVLHEITWSAHPDVSENLLNCHIELAGAVFPANRIVGFSAATCTARFTVTNNITGGIQSFKKLIGTLVKDGAGTLQVTVTDNETTGTVQVNEGTFEMFGTGITLGKLVVKAGACFIMPEGGMTVTSAAFEDGAVIAGKGKLVVKGVTQKGKIILRDGAEVCYDLGAANNYVEKLEGKVVGHPVFWLDASKPETITYTTEDGVNYVTRWNDCREGEPMFCTNLVVRPTFINGEEMANKYVRLANHPNATTRGEIEQLVWSVPVKDIRAVFLVQDPSEGGGEILGRCSWRLGDSYYGSQGGPYYRGCSDNINASLIGSNYFTPCVKWGKFYLNGEAVVGYEDAYKGACMQLVEHHVNTAYQAGWAHYELWADAFGTGYRLDDDTKQFIHNANGGMRIAEYIIYTNDLTYVERVQTAQYLMNKWLNKDVTCLYDESTADGTMSFVENEEVQVDADKTAILNVAENGSITKSGDGRLVVESFKADDFTVKGGEVVIGALSLRSESVPDSPWVHVDASEASTLTTDADGNVTNWRCVGTDKKAYVPLSGSPKLVANTLNGRAVVSTGVRGATSAASMKLLKEDGNGFTHANGNGYIHDAPIYKVVYVVYGSKGGGGNLLGSYGNGYPWQGLTSDGSTILKQMMGNYDAYNSGRYEKFFNGTYVVRLNGEDINPFETKFSGKYDMFMFYGDWDRKSDTLATFGQGDTLSYRGGLEYAELIIYDHLITQLTRDSVEAYLRKKWFNVDTAGFRVPSCTTLLLENDAKVILGECFVGSGRIDSQSEGNITTGGLGGEGTVAGNVTLKDGVILAAAQADGSLGKVKVTGTLDMSAGGTIRLVGDLENLVAGSYPVFTANQINFGGTWTCEKNSRHLEAYVRYDKESQTVYVSVNSPGTMFILR